MKLFDIILEDGVRVEKSDEQLKKEKFILNGLKTRGLALVM